jgi:hypothetical protein
MPPMAQARTVHKFALKPSKWTIHGAPNLAVFGFFYESLNAK